MEQRRRATIRRYCTDQQTDDLRQTAVCPGRRACRRSNPLTKAIAAIGADVPGELQRPWLLGEYVYTITREVRRSAAA